MQTKLLELDLIESREDSFLWRDGLFVPLMTMCFMHCRNIRVDWLSTPQKFARAFQKRHGKLPVRRIGTVEITPMTKLISSATRPDMSIGERRAAAAHICRGHFKTYTEDHKLFGRIAGTFFWSDQLRNIGIPQEVEQEYKINTKGKTRRAGMN